MNEPVRILVVEDEENIRKILEYSLKIDGFDVFLAENGRMALELAQTEKPDVILLDWMMPEMDGLAVLSRLKNNKETEDIPVFMLTAKGVMSDVGRALYERRRLYYKTVRPRPAGRSHKSQTGQMQ